MLTTHTPCDSSWSVLRLPTFGNSVLPETKSPVEIDEVIGRKPAAPHADLSRVLYIPRHNHNVTHLPLYDVTDAYGRAVQDAPMGSVKYKVNLSMLKRPTGECNQDNVQHLVDFYGSSRAVVLRRCLGQQDAEVAVHFNDDNNSTFTLETSFSEKGTVMSETEVTTSFPLPDRQTSSGTRRYPFFTMMSVNSFQRTDLQWQIHPAEHGSLRYTLVEFPRIHLSPLGSGPVVKAIYHHVGIGIDLPSDYTEGVLLLSERYDEEYETWIVGSLLGLLRQVRSLHVRKRKPILRRVLSALSCEEMRQRSRTKI